MSSRCLNYIRIINTKLHVQTSPPKQMNKPLPLFSYNFLYEWYFNINTYSLKLPVQASQLRKGQIPLLVRGTVHISWISQRFMVIEPILDSFVFVIVHLNLNGLKGLHVQYVVGIVKRRLLVVKRWKPEISLKLKQIKFQENLCLFKWT